MQEIIPYIRELWRESCAKMGREFILINVDKESPKDFLKKIMPCEFLVVSCFNMPIARALYFIRGQVQLPIPWVFYLHNQATIGLWPLYEFKIGDLLHTGDTFVGTCLGDQKSMELVFENASYLNLPFTKTPIQKLSYDYREQPLDIIFMGRISRQKKLDKLIKAFHLLKKERPEVKLHFYGKEDHLDSPNMGGEKLPSYLNELKELAGSEKDIHFHGFIDREVFCEQWRGKEFIFCSPSVHSDENFGMAALMSFELGGRLVLSEWGGHCNYREAFGECVKLVPIYESAAAPSPDIEELAKLLGESLDVKAQGESDFFAFDKAISSVIEWFKNEKKKHEALVKTSYGEKLHAQRLLFKGQGHAQKLFKDYADPMALEMLRAYGAKKSSV